MSASDRGSGSLPAGVDQIKSEQGEILVGGRRQGNQERRELWAGIGAGMTADTAVPRRRGQAEGRRSTLERAVDHRISGGREGPGEARGPDMPAVDVGGSAMPCGLVLPAASAKLVDGDCEPDVRPAALSNW